MTRSVSYTHLLNREVYVEKVTELYKLNRKYDEWKDGLEVYLNNNDYNDVTKVINLIVNECNDGDLTKIPNVCLLYTSRCV